MKNMSKKKYVVILLVTLFMVSFVLEELDRKRILECKEPMFSIKIAKNDKLYYIGSFYYISGEVPSLGIEVNKDTPMHEMRKAKVGIWFLPGRETHKGVC